MIGIGLVLGGLVITAVVHLGLLALSGMNISDIQSLSQGSSSDLSASLTRWMLLTQHLFVFVLSSLVYGLILYKSGLWSGLDLSRTPGWVPAFLGIVFLMVAYPLVNLSFLVNEIIPLPQWAVQYEDQTAEILGLIMENMNSPVIFLVNVLIIAILPGIGEELVFRGIIQKQLGGIFRSKVAGIWVSAIIFSAIHLQFEGFLPRMALGAVLGYLYVWTRNLWVPIVAHAFNNGIQVVMIYSLDLDMSTFDEQSSHQLQWWMIPLSVGLMFATYTAIKKKSQLSLHD